MKSQTCPCAAAGRPCKLTNEQVAALEKLLREGATSHGWSNEVWTRKRVAVVIRRHFKVTLGQQSISKLLKRRLGWSLKNQLANFEIVTTWKSSDG